jgi:hypothetical protein
MTEPKARVVITKHWTNPEILVTVALSGIGVQIHLKDFIDALVLEAGNPSMLVTKNGLNKRLKAAAEIVVQKMKQETVKVV